MKKMLAVALVAGLGSVGGEALAGFKTSQPVVISLASMLANGDVGHVYNSADVTQQIGCTISANSGSSSASCFARDNAGTTASCYTTSAQHIAAIASVSGDSYLIFRWDASGNCTNITVKNGSTTRPKIP